MFINHITGIIWEQAVNATVYDINGRDYIDYTSGIFSSNIGHSNEYVHCAIQGQSRNMIHTYTYGCEIREQYIEALCKFTGFEDAALFSSGTEATEAAWKIARTKTGKQGVWGADKAFHGKTLGAQIMAGKYPSYHYAQTRDKTGLLIVEPYVAFTAAFRSEKEISRYRGFQNDGLLLAVDEIQAGFGRTGKLFGYQHYNHMDPDFVCIGKGMGNGFPISGLLGPKDLISESFFDLSSTHGGNPLGCAIGLAVLDYFKDHNVIAEAERKGEILHKELYDLPVLTAGKGMVAGLLFETAGKADEVVLKCAEKGLLVVHTGKQTVKLGPPLTIPDDQLLTGLEILKEVVNGVME